MAQSGDLDRRVKFSQPTVTPDGYAGQVDGFAERFTVWGKIMYLRGTEAVQQARLQSRQPIVLTVRNSSVTNSVTAEWIAQDVGRGVDYNIRTIVPTDDGAFLELTCESGVAV